MQNSPDAKKPCKGILKTSSSFDRPSASYRKSAKFDELNVLQTYHPEDKDYGHMKIDEPKTPYNYAGIDPENADQLDADLLAEKLRIAANTQSASFSGDNASDEEIIETPEEQVRRLEFERRRKAHYNEFEAVRLARKLIEEELDDEDDEEEVGDQESVGKSKSESQASGDREKIQEEPQQTNDTGAASPSKTTAGRPMDIDTSHHCTRH